MEKRDYPPLMFGEDDVDTMRQLRRALDPNELSNLGKMLHVAVL